MEAGFRLVERQERRRTRAEQRREETEVAERAIGKLGCAQRARNTGHRHLDREAGFAFADVDLEAWLQGTPSTSSSAPRHRRSRGWSATPRQDRCRRATEPASGCRPAVSQWRIEIRPEVVIEAPGTQFGSKRRRPDSVAGPGAGKELIRHRGARSGRSLARHRRPAATWSRFRAREWGRGFLRESRGLCFIRGSSVKRLGLPWPSHISECNWGSPHASSYGERVDGGADDHLHRPFTARARPERGRHAALVGKRASEPAVRGFREQVERTIEIGLAAPVRPEDHVRLPEVETKLANRTVAGDVDVGDHPLTARAARQSRLSTQNHHANDRTAGLLGFPEQGPMVSPENTRSYPGANGLLV